MNPEPVIVTDVSLEPAKAEDGVVAVMAGTGFEIAGGLVVTPAQPVINQIKDSEKAERAHVARFIEDFPARNKRKLMVERDGRYHTCFDSRRKVFYAREA